MPSADYSSTTVPDLTDGDRLVFYTDGITEALAGRVNSSETRSFMRC
jgi:serine phosphatase RsbU (regulator of sigma subunit)